MPDIITKERFEQLFKGKLGEYYDRALLIFEQYGKVLSWDVANVLLHAIDKGKIGDVLLELERHWEENLRFQHPDIRGKVKDQLLNINKTEMMFKRIFSIILQIQPT